MICDGLYDFCYFRFQKTHIIWSQVIKTSFCWFYRSWDGEFYRQHAAKLESARCDLTLLESALRVPWGSEFCVCNLCRCRRSHVSEDQPTALWRNAMFAQVDWNICLRLEQDKCWMQLVSLKYLWIKETQVAKYFFVPLGNHEKIANFSSFFIVCRKNTTRMASRIYTAPY